MTSTGTERQRAHRVSHLWPLVSGAVALGVVAAAGALIALRQSPLGVDAEWMAEIVEHRNRAWEIPSLVMNSVGGGVFGVFVVPIGIALLLVALKRRWAALFFLLASVLSAGMVQLLKNLFGRARPEDILVAADYGSFPSGHTANAATIAVTLGIIFRKAWVWVAGVAYTVLMLLSRTYLGAHWLSDTLGGMLLGAGVAVIVWAPLALRLQRERDRSALGALGR